MWQGTERPLGVEEDQPGMSPKMHLMSPRAPPNSPTTGPSYLMSIDGDQQSQCPVSLHLTPLAPARLCSQPSLQYRHYELLEPPSPPLNVPVLRTLEWHRERLNRRSRALARLQKARLGQKRVPPRHRRQRRSEWHEQRSPVSLRRGRSALARRILVAHRGRIVDCSVQGCRGAVDGRRGRHEAGLTKGWARRERGKW